MLPGRGHRLGHRGRAVRVSFPLSQSERLRFREIDRHSDHGGGRWYPKPAWRRTWRGRRRSDAGVAAHFGRTAVGSVRCDGHRAGWRGQWRPGRHRDRSYQAVIVAMAAPRFANAFSREVAMSMLLQTSGLSRQFGGLVALSDVAIGVAAGSVHGLIGPNGAGKTTMLNLISGHLRPTGGQIHFEDNAITRWPVERRARLGIRRTFQNLKLFRDMTVLENVMVGMHGQTDCEIWHAMLRTPRQRAEEAAIVARAREALDFVGLLHLAGSKAAALPYGSQRLVEIARAIVARPKLLLLDEPAAGLNGAESKRIVELIRKIRATGTTI